MNSMLKGGGLITAVIDPCFWRCGKEILCNYQHATCKHKTLHGCLRKFSLHNQWILIFFLIQKNIAAFHNNMYSATTKISVKCRKNIYLKNEVFRWLTKKKVQNYLFLAIIISFHQRKHKHWKKHFQRKTDQLMKLKILLIGKNM